MYMYRYKSTITSNKILLNSFVQYQRMLKETKHKHKVSLTASYFKPSRFY